MMHISYGDTSIGASEESTNVKFESNFLKFFQSSKFHLNLLTFNDFKKHIQVC